MIGISRLHRLYNRRRYHEELDNVTPGRGPAYLPVRAVEADQDSTRRGTSPREEQAPADHLNWAIGRLRRGDYETGAEDT